MLKNGSTFYRVIIHTLAVLFLIGMLGSTALGGEDLLTSVVQAIYTATFGSSQVTTSGSSTLSSPSDPQPDNGHPNQSPAPPDTVK